ncbi:uncharacterized protein LOC106708429 isoform X2 [Papilio machaon]|uniref:uncharacterized protein LOC106708429 isoform X2 n=1 Tax=Papilio machaon TaxID=76193 RepID=UPI001E6655A1|nr:uncharacterized protein LOC106708429 isoform X2 [Papilio machaon]
MKKTGFRTGAIGITADIQKAFLQISISPADRNYLKFLWWENEDCNNVIVYRHCRVVFGLTCSPFLLSATLIHYLNSITGAYQQSAQLLKKSWYVDNCITSLDTEEEARKFIAESKHIMNEAKFNLRMWVTAPLEINETGKDIVPILGLSWDTKSDQLYCSNIDNLPDSEDIKQLTKRDLLSLTQKVFDPIGYTSPVMLTPKLILQETWKNNMSWESPLDADLMKKFHEWYKTFHYLKNCKIPRRLTEDTMKECEISLHLFCDASKDGYAAGVLLRAEKNKKVTTQLISAKSRVTPPKKISIPRLELLAALIGARLLTQVRENLNLQHCSEYCWTDSAVTLCWINRELPLNTFVGNRIKEIRQHTNTNNWRHIPGEHNWADLASRGCNAKTLLETRWWEGPAWLRLEPQQWPKSNFTVDELQVHLETKKIVSNIQVCCNESFIKKIQYFSKYSKMIRMVAWMLRFIYNTQHSQNKRKGEITYSEYNNAEKTLVKLIQNTNSEINKEKSEHLTQYLDKEGLIRIKTKLTISDFPETTKAPYLLWANNPIVTAMVRQRHEQLQHVGSNELITDLRARFWIIGIRRLVKTIIATCVICKRYRAKASRAPTAPLPPERTSCSAAFQTTGVDLAGPLFLRNGEKCWIVIYTCAVYRAVHLELTRSLSTEAFIMTLRRFVARRGRPDLMMSDQGTNFCGTKNLILSLDWEEVQRHSTVRRISWKMNAPSAAWWGGYWERLIRIMKDLLRRILGRDGVDRTARVRTAIGTKIRPIQRLYKLEVSNFTGDNVSLSQSPISSPSEENSPEISHLCPEISVAPVDTKSRSGRTIKRPSKYDIYV